MAKTNKARVTKHTMKHIDTVSEIVERAVTDEEKKEALSLYIKLIDLTQPKYKPSKKEKAAEAKSIFP